MPSGVYIRSAKQRANMSQYMTGRTGTLSTAYKDGRATYEAIHMWLKFHYIKGDACEDCGKKPKWLDWANISGEYRRDRKDFKVLCRSCHHLMDNKNLCKKKLHTLSDDNTIVHPKLLPSGLVRRECLTCFNARRERTRLRRNEYSKLYLRERRKKMQKPKPKEPDVQ